MQASSKHRLRTCRAILRTENHVDFEPMAISGALRSELFLSQTVTGPGPCFLGEPSAHRQAPPTSRGASAGSLSHHGL